MRTMNATTGILLRHFPAAMILASLTGTVSLAAAPDSGLKPRGVCSDPRSWKPVPYQAQAPTGGVTPAEDGLFLPVMTNNIRYLLDSFSNDHMLFPFRLRVGQQDPPAGDNPQHKFWDKQLRGSSAGRFMMGAGETLRWIEHAELRKRLNDLIDGIEACRETNGYILAYPPDKPVSEEPNYARAWFTHGLIEAAIAGNPKAGRLLRGHADWFNHWDLLPRLLYWSSNNPQGHIASTRTYFSPVGKPEDLQVAEKYYVCDWWMDQLAARDPAAVWKYPLNRPHCYLITSFEAYLDHYRGTGDRRYLDAMLGAWDLIHDHWEHVGGSMAICEGPPYPPRSYYLREELHTGETCGSVFWIKFNQRFHQLYPTQEKYVNEIEKSIYNVCLPNQAGSQGIRYHTRMEGALDKVGGFNTCCEGQGTRLFGSLPEYIFSIAKDGLYVNLFEPSSIRCAVAGQKVALDMNSKFPFEPDVTLKVTVAKPLAMKVRIRVPAWATAEMPITVNGRRAATGKPGTYAVLDRKWADGDTVTFTLPTGCRATRYTGADQIQGHNRYALEYGPLLLAAVGPLDGTLGMRIAQSPGSPRDWLQPKPGQPLHFTVKGQPECEFMPCWDIGARTFTCYPVFDPPANDGALRGAGRLPSRHRGDPAFVVAAQASVDEARAAQRLQGAFVWTQAEAPHEQTYAVFRKTFELEKASQHATLRIFADVRYLLWINGEYVERGPCRFSALRPEFDTLDVTRYLKTGSNAAAVLVHYPGYLPMCDRRPEEYTSQCARMKAHRPALAAELELTHTDGKKTFLSTDATWRCTTDTGHLASPPAYGSIFDVIDARRDSGDWHRLDFNHASWPSAVPLSGGFWEPLQPRSIPLLRQEVVTNLTLVGAQPTATGPGPLESRLPLELTTGSEVVIDCGREVQAYAALDFEADAGSQLELHYATLFFDLGRVPGWGRAPHKPLGGPNRYTARAGRQTYLTTDTVGFKYLVIRVPQGRIKLLGLRVVDRLYPFQRLGRFASSDDTLDHIWQTGVRTVEVCCEDAHVDCADCERAQWMADGYMMGYPVARVALAGPGDDGRLRYADGRLLRNMLRHMGDSQLPDGRLQPMQPAEYPVQRTHGVIDDYSCLWMQAEAELYRRDGDVELVRDLWPVMVRAVDYYLQRRTERGLVYAGEFVYFANPLAYVTCEGATLNAYFYRSLQDAAELARAVNDSANALRFATAAEELRTAYNRVLWDEPAGTYRGAVVPPKPPVSDPIPPQWTKRNRLPLDADYRTPPTAHAALMALYYEVVPPDRKARVFAFLRKRFPAENANAYTYAFYLETLFRQDTPEMDRAAVKTIRDRWVHMTKAETGTTTEHFKGGSTVHEAGAHPAYFLSSYVLGVRTEGPREARRLVIDPRLGDLTHAEGTTLTEFGPVSGRWQRDENQSLIFEIDNAAKVPALVSLRLPDATASLTVDGKPLLRQGTPAAKNVSVEAGRVRFHLQPGKHFGQLAGK